METGSIMSGEQFFFGRNNTRRRFVVLLFDVNSQIINQIVEYIQVEPDVETIEDLEEQRFQDQVENDREMLLEELNESGLTITEYYGRLDQESENVYINDMIKADCGELVDQMINTVVEKMGETTVR